MFYINFASSEVFDDVPFGPGGSLSAFAYSLGTTLVQKLVWHFIDFSLHLPVALLLHNCGGVSSMTGEEARAPGPEHAEHLGYLSFLYFTKPS